MANENDYSNIIGSLTGSHENMTPEQLEKYIKMLDAAVVGAKILLDKKRKEMIG